MTTIINVNQESPLFFNLNPSYCLETVLLFNLPVYNREPCHGHSQCFLFNRNTTSNSLTFLHGSVLCPPIVVKQSSSNLGNISGKYIERRLE